MRFDISITLVINTLIVMLTILLLIYPSWLVGQNAHIITRLSVILFITLGIYFYRKGLIQYFKDENALIKIDQNDIITILIFGFINYLSLQIYRNGQYSIIGDEYGHSIGAVFGFTEFVNEYKEYISLMILILAILTIKCYKIFPQYFKFNSFLYLCIFLAMMELTFLEFYNIDKNVTGIYRYPGFGKIYSALVYQFTGINEFTFRIPNHIIYALLFSLLYVFMKCLGCTIILAILGSLAIVTSPLIRFYSGLQYLEILWIINYVMACFGLYLSEKHERDIYLVMFIMFCVASFYTRNVSMVLIIVLMVLFPLLQFESQTKRWISNKKYLYVLLYISSPMLLWHTLYSINRYITRNITQTDWFFREYTFGFDWLEYTNSLQNYLITSLESFNIILIALFILSFVFTILNFRSALLQKFLLVTFFGFIILLLGDEVGWGWSGYGRFLLMIISPLIVMYMILLASIKHNILIYISYLVLLSIVSHNVLNYSNNIEIYNAKFNEPEFYNKNEYTALITKIKKSDASLALNEDDTELHSTLRILGEKYITYSNYSEILLSEFNVLNCGMQPLILESDQVFKLRDNYKCTYIDTR